MKCSMLALILLAAAAAGLLIAAPGVGRNPDPERSKEPGKAETTMVTKTSKAGYDITPLSTAKVDDLAKKLTPEEAKVILRKGTEAPFCGNLLDNKKEGVYTCRLCDLPLFASNAKFDSGTGWPSFFQPFDKDHVVEKSDKTMWMERKEILCARCGGHLGHVFDDGPRPTGLRFCLNSASLTFVDQASFDKQRPQQGGGAVVGTPMQTATAYFAAGCFWGVEDYFQQVPGVIDASSGYMGGRTKSPTYKEVCSKDTGHAETVKVVYDPSKVAYRELLAWFFKLHDPTQVNRQGPDVGSQYRSAVFTTTPEQLEEAKKFLIEQQKTARFRGRMIATEILPQEQSGPYYLAEEYHQDYHAKHGGSCALPEK